MGWDGGWFVVTRSVEGTERKGEGFTACWM